MPSRPKVVGAALLRCSAAYGYVVGIRELADKSGVDMMSVQRIESGRRAHPPTMAKIEAASIEEVIVLLGEVQTLHGESVTLRWDKR